MTLEARLGEQITTAMSAEHRCRAALIARMSAQRVENGTSFANGLPAPKPSSRNGIYPFLAGKEQGDADVPDVARGPNEARFVFGLGWLSRHAARERSGCVLAGARTVGAAARQNEGTDGTRRSRRGLLAVAVEQTRTAELFRGRCP
jgi:hypothetical protein